MVRKGQAFVKPVVNKLYKSEVRKQAQVSAAADVNAMQGAQQLNLATLNAMITESGLPAARRGQAHPVVFEALKKIQNGVNPLSGLDLPKLCGPCHGQHGATHHFLCQARTRFPGVEEKILRDRVMHKLAELYRAVHVQQACGPSSRCSHRATRGVICCVLTSPPPNAADVDDCGLYIRW